MKNGRNVNFFETERNSPGWTILQMSSSHSKPEAHFCVVASWQELPSMSWKVISGAY